MGEVACVPASLLCLGFAMGEQFVDFIYQRAHLAREILGDAGLRAGPDGDHLAPHPPEGPVRELVAWAARRP